MLTEEGRLKRYVSKHLKSLGAYYYMSVPSGYGRQTLDYLVCFQGKFYGVETKAPGKEPTARQWQCIEEINKAGGAAFACDSEESFDKACELYGLIAPSSAASSTAE